MLKIDVPEMEFFDESKNEFIRTKAQTMQLEHSLLSVSKWESKYKKPFLSEAQKTPEETVYYIKCMTLTQNVDESAYQAITYFPKIMSEVNKYIDDPMTATTFSNQKKGNSHQKITSELIYYWMVVNEIPFECQKWHLNRLLTLIHICSEKNGSSGKKMSTKDILRQNREANAMRRKALNSKG